MPSVSPDLDDRERGCVNEILRTAQIAYVAVVESGAETSIGAGENRPYVVPMNFAYEPAAGPSRDPGSSSAQPIGDPRPEGRLLLHTGPGRKVDALRGNPRVCVAVTSQEQLELGPTPCEDGYIYQSVLLEGHATMVIDESERERALRAIVAKYDPDAAAKPFKPQVFAKTLIYVVEVGAIGFKERPKRR